MNPVAAVEQYVDAYFDLPVAFQFTVKPMNAAALAAASLTGSSFKEVSGLEATIEKEDVIEGGENRFVHQLPKSISYSKLKLSRGVAAMDSYLVIWCKKIFDLGLAADMKCMDLSVSLLDEQGMPLRSWVVYNAWPISWQVEGFSSTKNEVAIEVIELSYSYFERTV